jgi:hypothetical protein
MIGLAHVEWSPDEQFDVKVTLRFEMVGSRVIPVTLKLPGQSEKMVDTTWEVTLRVRREG